MIKVNMHKTRETKIHIINKRINEIRNMFKTTYYLSKEKL